MFKEYDRVVFDDQGSVGTVLEVCDDIVYVETDYGVELEMAMSQLMTKDEYKEKKDEEHKKMMARHAGRSKPAGENFNTLKAGLWKQSVNIRQKERFVSFLNTFPRGRELLHVTRNLTTAEEKFDYIVEFLNVPGSVLEGTIDERELFGAVLVTAILNNMDAASQLLEAKASLTIEAYERNK